MIDILLGEVVWLLANEHHCLVKCVTVISYRTWSIVRNLQLAPKQRKTIRDGRYLLYRHVGDFLRHILEELMVGTDRTSPPLVLL